MTVYVFLGPTLKEAEARRLLEAVYLPPASMGDVQALMKKRPHALALIDGYFERTPAVWHKELLYALSQGVRVLGAASMGALRAAELHSFGMEGIGSVFEAYRDGVLEDEDEVAVAHGPAESGYCLLSEAMVNLREGLRRAEAEAVVSSSVHHALLAMAKALYYPERSWPRLFEEARRGGVPEPEVARLQAFIARSRPNPKRADAEALLKRLARGEAGPARIPFDFQPTRFWVRMCQLETRVGVEEDPEGQGLRTEDFGRHVRLVAQAPLELLRGALLLLLAAGEAPSVEGLTPESPPEALDALLTELPHALREGVDRFLCAELRRRHVLEPLLETALRKQQFLRRLGLTDLSPSPVDLSESTLLQWYNPQESKKGVPARALAQARGFASEEEFLSELRAHYLYQRHLSEAPSSPLAVDLQVLS